jgi:hydrogenase-4 component B
MLVPMVGLALGCVGIGLAPLIVWPAVSSGVADWQGTWVAVPAPESLRTLGLIHMALALAAVGGAAWLWRRAHRVGCVRGPTWDCGYAFPTARMQYTAGSFAGIITEWFAWILQPVRHAHRPEALFPGQASLEEHTPETVLERVIEPVARGVMWVSGLSRRLQQGRVQAYLLYLIIGLAAVAALAVAWTQPGVWPGEPVAPIP